MAGGDDFVYEGRPVVRPLLLENGHKDEVELVQKGSLRLERFLGGRALDDKIHNEIANT